MKLSQLALGAAVSVGVIGLAPMALAAELFFEGDMVRGGTKDGETGPHCVITSQYKRQERVVWRVRVLQDDGQPADDKALKSLIVEIPGGEQFPMHYGDHPHGEPTDSFWATSWAIPADYPTGTIGYKVIATDMDGSTQEWEPFNVAVSKLTVIPGEVTFTK